MDFINQKLARHNIHISPRKPERAEVKEGGGGRRKSTSKPTTRACTYCKKREPPSPRAEQKLKRCARCRSALYCSRTCQRADWKRGGHQRMCSVGAIMVGNSYLDSLPTVEAVMDQLIDAYRLRVEDERMYCGRLKGRYTTSPLDNNNNNDSSSNDQTLKFAFQDFRDFLDLAECHSTGPSDNQDDDENNDFASSSPSSSTTHDTNDTDTNSASSPTPSSSSSSASSSSTNRAKNSILPRWWDAEKRAYCELRAMNQTAEGNTWSNLLHPAGKDDILAHYADQLMPMKLRLLAERVYGSDIMGGQSH